MMEAEGVVSPAAGGKAREVLVDQATSTKSTRN
jgi:hypothetical protein